MKDAFWKDGRFLIGFGPGSWRLLSYTFQSKPYQVLCLHSGYLQILFENGLPFALLFFGTLFRALYRFYKSKDSFRFTAMALCLLHSLTDFDLYFGCMLLMVGLLAGKAESTFNGSPADTSRNNATSLTTRAVNTGLLVLSSVLVLYMASEGVLRNRFEKSYLGGDSSRAYAYAQKLEILCPRDSVLQSSLAALAKLDGQPKAVVLAYLEKAIALSPNSVRPYMDLADYTDNAEQLAACCQKALSLNPLQAETVARVQNILYRQWERGVLSEHEYKNLCRTLQPTKSFQNT